MKCPPPPGPAPALGEEYRQLVAPLIAGNDLSNMSAATRAILLNKEIIANDQGTLGIQAHHAEKAGDAEVWVRPVIGGGRAVALLNCGTAAIPITVTWQQLAYPDHLQAHLRDAWKAEDLGRFRASYSAVVPSHSVVVLKVLLTSSAARG
jgi:alpha-galactosidase